MKGGCGRTHHDCTNLKWNFIGENKDTATRHFNELGVTAVTIFADHLHLGAELFIAAKAEIASTTANEIVDTNAIAR